MIPLDGDAFFNSPITAGPSCDMATSRLRNPRGVCAAAACSRGRTCARCLAWVTRSRVAAKIWSRVVMATMIKYRGWAGKTEGEKPQKHAKNANTCLLPKGTRVLRVHLRPDF